MALLTRTQKTLQALLANAHRDIASLLAAEQESDERCAALATEAAQLRALNEELRAQGHSGAACVELKADNDCLRSRVAELEATLELARETAASTAEPAPAAGEDLRSQVTSLSQQLRSARDEAVRRPHVWIVVYLSSLPSHITRGVTLVAHPDATRVACQARAREEASKWHQQFLAAEAERRECHNQLQELRGACWWLYWFATARVLTHRPTHRVCCAGNIRVYCRIKPVPRTHRVVLRQGAATDGEDRKVLVQHPRTGREQKFGVDHVFPGQTSQGMIWVDRQPWFFVAGRLTRAMV